MLLKRFAAAVLVVVALLGAACGSDDDPSIDTGSAAEDHNDADLEFTRSMVPHHEQAVDMAELATARASDPRVKDLAARIEQAQEPQIATMRGWLRDWGEAPPPGEGGAHAEMDISGMMSGEEMTELEQASGPEFDRLFLTMMIRHHEGAVAMAKSETESGKFAPARQLATQITTAQQVEIEEMEGLLAATSQ